jgi:hypothetical protein|tara:strand:+ start:765 stop:1934 length:1170 start_codon:yes stop_codon:yes gene_type:complete
MGFNVGGFLGGVSEGVNDAILREEERLDEKLTMNRQEASLQRRDKNKERLRKEVLLEELTEQLGMYHTEEQVAEMAGKGLGAMKQFAVTSQTAFAAGRDPSAAYNWANTTANLAPVAPLTSTQQLRTKLTGESGRDDLEQTTIKPTSFLKKPQKTYKTFDTTDKAFDNLAQQIAAATINKDTKKIAELTAYKNEIVKQALTFGDGSGASKDATYTSVINMERKAFFPGRNYSLGVEGDMLDLTSGDGGRVAVDNYGFAFSLASNSYYKNDKKIMAHAQSTARQAMQDARSFADTQYNNRGEGRYFEPDPSRNYHVIDVSGLSRPDNPMTGAEKKSFMNGKIAEYRKTNKIGHGSAIIFKETNQNNQSVASQKGVWTNYGGGQFIGYNFK